MMNNRSYKYKFEAAYPISPELYINSRFKLEEFTPFNIKIESRGEHLYSFEEGIKLLREYQEMDDQLISMYEFEVKDDNTLIETFYLREYVRYQILTKVEGDIMPFFNCIFPLFGVLLYGEFDSKEHFLVRDDVCCKFAHEIYPKHTDLSATWWDDKPFINHFFAFPKKEWEDRKLKSVVAIGGEPLEFGYSNIKNTSANFYLMKYIPRYGKEAYIKPTDDLSKVEDYEKEIIQSTLKGLDRERIDYKIYHSVIEG